MIKILLSVITLVLFINTSPVFAQEVVDYTTDDNDTTQFTDTSSFFTVELYTETQSPWDKSIPVVIKFRSNIDAKRVEVSWDSQIGVSVVRQHNQFIDVQKDQVYTLRAKVIPEVSGLYNIAGNVTVWQYDTNYTTSSSTSIRFGDDLVTVPQSPGYGGAVILRYIVIFFIIIFILGALYFGFKYLLNYLKVWLRPPE